MTELPSCRFFVEPDWIDSYGHMTAARYAEVFDRALQQLLEMYGLGAGYTQEARCGLYTVELNIKFIRELLESDPIQIYMKIDSVDSKRITTSFRMFQSKGNYLAAISEQNCIHVDLRSRRVIPFPEPIQAMLREVSSEHQESSSDAQSPDSTGY